MRIYIFIILISVILFSCSEKAVETKAETQFCLTDTLFANKRLDTVNVQTVKNELRLSGKVTPNDNQLVKIFPVVSGNLIDLKVGLGDQVTKGQVLAIVRSGDIAELENQLLTAQADLITAQKNLNVQEDLYRTGLTSEKEVVQAKNEAQKLESAIAKIKEKQSIYGVGHSSMYYVKSPISGFIVEKNPAISENMMFEKEDIGAFFTIANLDEVFITVGVYESDIARVKEGFPVNISLISYPDKKFTGKIDKVFNVLDPETRVMKARIRMDNHDYLLKPEMFARVDVHFDGDRRLPAISSKSVIFDKNRYFVMVYKDRCKIETREVKPFQTTGETTYIESGLEAGETVLSRYQLLVYDALND